MEGLPSIRVEEKSQRLLAIELYYPNSLILAGIRLMSVQRSCVLPFLSFIPQPVQCPAHIYSCNVTVSCNIPNKRILLAMTTQPHDGYQRSSTFVLKMTFNFLFSVFHFTYPPFPHQGPSNTPVLSVPRPPPRPPR
jgi:hypothetical protein